MYRKGRIILLRLHTSPGFVTQDTQERETLFFLSRKPSHETLFLQWWDLAYIGPLPSKHRTDMAGLRVELFVPTKIIILASQLSQLNFLIGARTPHIYSTFEYPANSAQTLLRRFTLRPTQKAKDRRVYVLCSTECHAFGRGEREMCWASAVHTTRGHFHAYLPCMRCGRRRQTIHSASNGCFTRRQDTVNALQPEFLKF